jgi:outer membrane protein assembly factor BamB
MPQPHSAAGGLAPLAHPPIAAPSATPRATASSLQRRSAARLLLLALALLGTMATAEDWPQWMGPKRDGVWREKGVLERFAESGPKILWRVPVQGGYSGPTVADGRVFLMDRSEGPRPERKKGERALPVVPGKERILCLDAKSGSTLWEHAYERAYQIDFPAGPRNSPLLHKGRVYTLGAMGDLLCLEAVSGRLVWERHFLEEFKGLEPPIWGFASQLLIEGKSLICTVGGEGSAVVAFDLATGKELWRSLSTKEIGYAPSLLVQIKGRRQLIIWLSDLLASLDPATGKPYWTMPYPAEGKPQRPEVTIATPRFLDGKLFLSSFYHGSTLLDITGANPTVIWNRHSSSKSTMNDGLHTVMCTPVLQGGHVYGVCGMGEFRCLEMTKGDRIWETYAVTGGKEGLFANAFLVQHGNRHFIWNDQGELIIARLTPKGCEEISRARLMEPAENARGRDVVWSHPAFANRCVFVRNGKELVCASLRFEHGSH